MKEKLKLNFLWKILGDYLFGILAGISISFGGIAFLSSGNKIVGALFFTIGLFMVLVFKFNLFTGKVCYSFDNKPSYILRLLIIWIGNFTGAVLMGLILQATRLTALQDACVAIVNTKLSDSLISLFILGIFCNILIYLAVHGFNNFENPIFKTLALFFGVSVFVLCGFEHCVADMFYFSFAGAWSWNMIARLLIITLGNIVGGLLIPGVIKIYKLIENKSNKEK